MNKPKVSIIVPVYRTERYLKECVDSILSQTLRDFELILVDDRSPDNSPKMCDEYAKQDERVKVIHNEVNQGLIKSRQVGLKHSTCDYIQFIDSDDYIEPAMTERLYKRAISGDFDIVYCDLIRFKGRDLSFSLPFDTRGRDKADIVNNMILDNFPHFLVTRLFKRRLFDNIVWPDFPLREDTVTCIQLYLNAEKVAYEYSLLYRYRYNDSSISSNNRNRYRLINQEYENFKKLAGVIKNRPDYDLYRASVEKMLKWYNKYDRFKPFYYAKRFFMSFVPYGMLLLYRTHANYNIGKFLASFLPYGAVVVLDRIKNRFAST